MGVSSSMFESFCKETKNIMDEMDRAGKPWVIKDPRMSLTAKAWLTPSPSNSSVCVLVIRSPVSSAYRFLGYNRPKDSFSAKEWGYTWEEYTARPLAACMEKGVPIVLFSYEEFAVEPVRALEKLHDLLVESGVDAKKLKRLSSYAVLESLGREWVVRHTAKMNIVDAYLPTLDEFLSPRGRELIDLTSQGTKLFEASAKFRPGELEEVVWNRFTPPNAREAYVTLVGPGLVDEATIQNLGVLAPSITRFDGSRDLVAVVDNESVHQLGFLTKAGWDVHPSSIAFPKWTENSPVLCNALPKQLASFLEHVLKTSKYDSILFIHPQAFVMKPLDTLFVSKIPMVSSHLVSVRGTIDCPVSIDPSVVSSACQVTESQLVVHWDDSNQSCTPPWFLNPNETPVNRIYGEWFMLEAVTGRTSELKLSKK